jgi:hypothetical protein
LKKILFLSLFYTGTASQKPLFRHGHHDETEELAKKNATNPRECKLIQSKFWIKCSVENIAQQTEFSESAKTLNSRAKHSHHSSSYSIG